MKIALASDHAGFSEKEKLKPLLTELGVEYFDLGTASEESVDYPDYARKVAEQVAAGKVDQGVLVCGSGTGMAITANKVPGVRAAVAWSEEVARLAATQRCKHPGFGAGQHLRETFLRSFARGSKRRSKADVIRNEFRKSAHSNSKRNHKHLVDS